MCWGVRCDVDERGKRGKVGGNRRGVWREWRKEERKSEREKRGREGRVVGGRVEERGKEKRA